MDISQTANLAVAILMTTGLVEVIKRAGLNSRYAPLASLLLGTICMYLLSNFVFSPEIISSGIIAGLSASGLWSGTKALAGTEDKVTIPLEDVKMTAPSDTPVDVEG